MSTPTPIGAAELELARFRSRWQQELQGAARRQQPQHQPQRPQWGPTATTPKPQPPQATPGPSKRRNLLVLGSPTASAAHTGTKPPHKGPAAPSNAAATYAQKAGGLYRQPPATARAPQSALDHFEEAIMREDEGSLGDSLNLYRKAYRVWILYMLLLRLERMEAVLLDG